MPTNEVSLDGLEDAIAFIEELQKRGEDLTAVLDQIGEYEAEATIERFEHSVAPDGTPWAGINPRRGVVAGNEKPLIHTGNLKDSITHRLYGDFAVGIGTKVSSEVEYGKYHQFGWGVTTRPFLGISEKDKDEIMEILHAHFIFI